MTPERWQRINELYHDALELDANGQATFLNQACGDDALLRREVESLISSHHQAGGFISEPALQVAAQVVAEDQATLLVGRTFSHYRIESLLGAGGMGEVYLAEDTNLNRKVALKLLPAYFTEDPERLRRFDQEARAASALNHPNILTIHETGQVDGHNYTATEFIDGETLRHYMARGRMKLDETLDVAIQIASALTAAHAAGIVHRDIKPENVMLRSDGLVKVLDFGLAKLMSGEPSMAGNVLGKSITKTNPGMVMGTAQYMSPEQARGQEVDARADIWSLGVVIYEMVTGHAPFSGETTSHVIVSILETEPPPLIPEHKIPLRMESIIGKALRKNREERYETVKDLLSDLKGFKQELELDAHLESSAAPEKVGGSPAGGWLSYGKIPRLSSVESVRQIKGHKRAVAVGAAAMVLLLGSLTYSYLKNDRQQLATSGEAIDSLAVLPFVNISADPTTEHLADGISDSVINSLSRLPKLKVRSLNAVLRYKGKEADPRNVGRDLNVGAVLMGRMTQRGDELTISAELVDVRDNRRLWGEQYHCKLSDILSVQEEIALKISEGLRLRLSSQEKNQLAKQHTENTEAYLLFSLGRYASNKNTKEGWEKAIEYYEQAIKIDPKFALAYVGLAETYREFYVRGFATPKESLRRREWAALKAVELDDTLSEAHVALAEAKQRWDWVGAEKECKRALELNPNSVDANQRYAQYLVYSARPSEAVVYAKRADELEQTSSRRPAFLGFVYFLSRQYDSAIEEYLKAIKTSPNFAHTHFFLGEAYVTTGRYKEGIEELRRAVELDNVPERWDRYPMLAYAYGVSGDRAEALKILNDQKRLAKQRYIAAYNFAIIYTGLGDKDRAFEYLNKAYNDGNPLIQVSTRPVFDSLRSDPRYTELLRRLGRNA